MILLYIKNKNKYYLKKFKFSLIFILFLIERFIKKQ